MELNKKDSDPDNIKILDNGNNKVVNNINLKFKNKGNPERAGIYVRGFPNDTQSELVKYFSHFGSVIWAHFGHDYVILDFTDPAAVEKVISKKTHFFQGKQLFLKRKKNTSFKVPINDDEINEQIYKSIILQLEKMNNFDEEFLCVARNLQPNVSESFQKYNWLCQDLYSVLSRTFPQVQVHPFGSTLTGLGFNNSDVDVFLSNIKQSVNDIDSLYTVKVLLLRSKKFANCFVVSTAKIPIVKCLHLRTKVKCDINIKSMLGVYNSKLIHYYLSIDIKVKEAMIISKYWAKYHKITGQNHLFTNYCLVLMFIFFLQESYGFPSVYSLQNPEYKDDTTDPWNGNFLPNLNVHIEKFSSTSLKDIISHFFEFYANFNFSAKIICPYLGESLPINYFESPENLPECYKKYKELLKPEENSQMFFRTNCPISVQDPFEHNRNVAAVVTDSVVEKFKLASQLASTIFSNNQRILYRLYTEETIQAKKLTCSFNNDSLKMNLLKSNNLRYLNIEANESKPLDDRWFECFKDFVLTSLQEFLQLTVTDSSDEESTAKENKTERQSDVHDKNELTFTCTGKINLWDSRKATAKTLNLTTLNSKLMDREKAITNHLKKMCAHFQDSTNIISFKMTLADGKGSTDIEIEKINAYKKSFKSFAMFFSTNIPLWFELYEKDMNKAAVEPNKPVS